MSRPVSGLASGCFILETAPSRARKHSGLSRSRARLPLRGQRRHCIALVNAHRLPVSPLGIAADGHLRRSRLYACATQVCKSAPYLQRFLILAALQGRCADRARPKVVRQELAPPRATPRSSTRLRRLPTAAYPIPSMIAPSPSRPVNPIPREMPMCPPQRASAASTTPCDSSGSLHGGRTSPTTSCSSSRESLMVSRLLVGMHVHCVFDHAATRRA